MPDILAETLALEGLGWILAVTFVAGLVYGFAGFGAALVFMPVASAFQPVPVVIAAFSVSAMSSLVTVVPRAWGQVEGRGLFVLIAAALVGAWGGIWVLRHADMTSLRWGVVAVTSLTLVALISGWRMKTEATPARRFAVGLASGFLGGAVGLLGPVMVLFQLAGPDGAARNRATTIVFLTLTSTLLLPLLALQGLLTAPALMLGALLLLPYGVGARIGQALFRPESERLYRASAYILITAAILSGVPRS